MKMKQGSHRTTVSAPSDEKRSRGRVHTGLRDSPLRAERYGQITRRDEADPRESSQQATTRSTPVARATATAAPPKKPVAPFTITACPGWTFAANSPP